MERTSRYTVPVALPAGRRDATTTCDALIDAVTGMPAELTKTLDKNTKRALKSVRAAADVAQAANPVKGKKSKKK